MTIGAIVEDGKPMICAGPMAQGAFKQLLAEHTEWPDLDYLIIDLPPGTGDITLTLCQTLPVTGAVIVATPQQVALDDAVRAVRMFQQLARRCWASWKTCAPTSSAAAARKKPPSN